MPDFKVLSPSSLAKNIPINAVRNIRAIVFKAPIFWPIFIIKNISMAGTAIISNSTVFI